MLCLILSGLYYLFSFRFPLPSSHLFIISSLPLLTHKHLSTALLVFCFLSVSLWYISPSRVCFEVFLTSIILYFFLLFFSNRKLIVFSRTPLCTFHFLFPCRILAPHVFPLNSFYGFSPFYSYLFLLPLIFFMQYLSQLSSNSSILLLLCRILALYFLWGLFSFHHFPLFTFMFCPPQNIIFLHALLRSSSVHLSRYMLFSVALQSTFPVPL